jgi:protein TonB
MTSNEILRADILDILFDNRNKQYGAYALRKTYNNRLGMALGISLSTILLVFFLMRMEGPIRTIANPNSPDVVVVDHIIPPDIKKPDPIIPKQATPAPQIRQVAFTDPVIKDDKLVDNPMVDQTDLQRGLISDQNIDGDDFNNIPVIKQPVPEDIPVKKEVQTVEPPVSKEPEFLGGVDAWMKFLQRNLTVPAELEAGETKTVAIKFSVSPEGVVTNFEIVKSAGAQYDNEVIRVLKKMPRWKPGIQNGQPVARVFTQPVTFMGLEQ